MTRVKQELLCPACDSGDISVINTDGLRSDTEGFHMARPPRRTRRCNACNHRWFTVEVNLEDVERIRHEILTALLAEMVIRYSIGVDAMIREMARVQMAKIEYGKAAE